MKLVDIACWGLVSAAVLCSPSLLARANLAAVQGVIIDGASAWGVPLKTGQIVATESAVPINVMYLLLYPEFSPFVHVGIVEVDHGDAYVYEAGGTYKLSAGAAPPTDNVSGYVRRTPLGDFLHEMGGTASVYESPTGVDLVKVLAYAKQHTASKTPFDAYFNYTDRSRLYCSEFVAAAFEAGGKIPYATVPVKPNTSMRVVLDWLKVKDRQILPVYQLVKQERWAGTISENYTLTELKVDRAVKAELYQRFTPDQKLGNVLAWGVGDVGLQPPIEQFRKAAFDAFDKQKNYNAAEVLQKVRQLAKSYLGEFDGGVISVCSIDFSLCH
ncbi:MAG: YiiX/YebB-like N1pC/P60 family cysteine hydrolase [Thiothrix sp.]|uniref:YiiX/YebB-like N1pC/P60 family cysteine hydrolase n=1 Tax=Thiothrix sp. TaxID=1032 RepID=UPI00261C660A|nr:YiiX/YebB-like N1pC/P60 family cysteine hydrolase [Thiothrix sp.]MDD5392938.1 YiiX/YebB-like N1pC/P60 family cysteine hydrolase [Thiothrix sp.]